MSARQVALRPRAILDVDEAVDHYLVEGGEQTALDFIHALEIALAHIASEPVSGSPRWAHELDIPGLRS